MMWRFFATAVCSLLTLTVVRAETSWRQFRGPDGQGRSAVEGLPLHWDEQTNIVWKTPIEGVGWSSPVVDSGTIWLTSATEVAFSEAEREAALEDEKHAEMMSVARTITLWASEIDLASGKPLQRIKLFEVESPQPIHSLNSFASPTPVLADGRLYCHFGDYGTACVETSTGQILWKERIALEHGVGPGSSPLLVDGLLILTCDGMDKQYVTALHAANGEIAWHTDRPAQRTDNPDFRKAFATPLLINVQGKDQVIIPGAQWCIAYNPRTGDEIWRVDHGSGFSNVPCPVFDGRHVFLCTGFSTAEIWAIRPDGHGDVTESHVDWKQKKQVPTMPSPVVFGERLYTINDKGIAQCFEASTGNQLWKKRIGGNFSASLLYADRRIYLCSHEGQTTVLAAGDEYQELAQNDLDGQLMASPVVVDHDLLLRSDSHLYRIGE